MKQTRQVVRAVKQSIFLDVYGCYNLMARFKNVNNCSNTNIDSYSETFGGQIYNPFLNVVHFVNTSAN